MNIDIIVADINKHEMEASFDRIISIEMFEVRPFLQFSYSLLCFFTLYKRSKTSLINSTWRTTKHFSTKYQSGWSHKVCFLFIIFATKHFLTILRYQFMISEKKMFYGELWLVFLNKPTASFQFKYWIFAAL